MLSINVNYHQQSPNFWHHHTKHIWTLNPMSPQLIRSQITCEVTRNRSTDGLATLNYHPDDSSVLKLMIQNW